MFYVKTREALNIYGKYSYMYMEYFRLNSRIYDII